jgi:hypothetical protein
MNKFIKYLLCLVFLATIMPVAQAAVPPTFIVSGSKIQNVITVDSMGIKTATGTVWISALNLNSSTGITYIKKLLKSDSILFISGNDSATIKATGFKFGTATKKFTIPIDTLIYGTNADTAIMVIRDKRDTALIRQRPSDSTLEISFNFGTTWWAFSTFSKVDTIGDGSGIVRVKAPFIFREGNNTSLSVFGDTIRISSTGGGGDNILAKIGSGAITDLVSPVVIYIDSGLTGRYSPAHDTLYITSVFGGVFDSADFSLPAAKNLRNNTVDSSRLIDNSISTADYHDSSVTISKIKNLAVTSAKIANNTIVRINMGTDAIDSINIANGSVTGLDIKAGTITGSNIGELTITNANIANGTIGSGQIATGGVGSLQIADGGVGAVDLAQSYLQDNKPDSISWNAQTQGGLFVLKVTDTVNRNTGVKLVQDTGAKFQIVNPSIADSTTATLELKLRQTGTSEVDIVARNLGANENRLEFWTTHIGTVAKRFVMSVGGASGDSSIFGSGSSSKLVLTGGATREIIIKDTLTILNVLRVVALDGSGVLQADTIHADSAIIAKRLTLSGTTFVNLAGYGLGNFGTTTLMLDTSTIKMKVDTGLANNYWSVPWPPKFKAGANISFLRLGNDTIQISSTGGGGSGQWAIINNNDTSILKGIVDTLLKVQKKSAKYVRVSAHNMDTLAFRANTLIVGDSGLTTLSAGLISNTVDTLTDLTGYGIIQSTAFKLDVDTTTLKPVFKPRYREVEASHIYYRRGAPVDSIYASLPVFIDSSTGVVWDVVDSTKLASKFDFIYFSIDFADTMSVDSLHYQYVTSGADSTGAMIDTIQIHKKFSPASGIVDTTISNVGVKKTGNTAISTGFLITARGVQPGERWTIRFRNKLAAANSFVRIAHVRAGGVPK